MDPTDLIASFATSASYAVTRRAKGTVQRGRIQPGASSTIQIVASVQPASGRDLLRLPEGRRSTETRVLYTVTLLLTGQQGAANEADLVAIDGQSWEVQHVEKWAEAPSADPTAYRCIVQVSR